MSRYSLFNISLAIGVLPTCWWLLRSRSQAASWSRVARVATLLVLIAYPWDFFAIQLGVWTYPNDPGPRIYTVPINDLVFIWLCTCLTSSILLTLEGQSARNSHPKGQSGAQQHT